jgi:hypothetical protein
MSGIAIHPITIIALQHISAFGPCTFDAMRAALPGLATKTVQNLVQLGHCLRTSAGVVITPKGREKLRSLFPGAADQAGQPAPARTALPAQPADQTPASASLMLSNAEIEATITQVLERARARLTLADMSRRTGLAEHLLRPTLTTMVQAGTVDTTAGKPALYCLSAGLLMRNRLRPSGMAGGYSIGTTGPSEQLPANAYRCPELQRNPGISADRFAAYALPSRVGKRLHWPDGRVTPVEDHPGMPA